MDGEVIPIQSYFNYDNSHGYYTDSSRLGSAWDITMDTIAVGRDKDVLVFEFESTIIDGASIKGWIYRPMDSLIPNMLTIWNN